jgi:predicted phosphodiesterase
VSRIAVVSDIHGNIVALEQVTADLAHRNVDVVVNLGDHCSGPLWPNETAHFLMRQDWTHILGNQDESVINDDPARHSPSDAYAFKDLDDRSTSWLRSLPSAGPLNGDVFLCHGTPSSTTEYFLETALSGGARAASRDEIRQRLGTTNSRLILCGHTHLQRVVEPDEGCTIVNPGSVGLPAYNETSPVPHVMESGSPHARYAVVEILSGRILVELLAIPYDWNRAAKKARKQGRPDWAVALQTGFASTPEP